MDFAIKVLAAYLLGSIVGSLLLGRLRGVDIRQQGSGNAGGTNALRTQGIWFALPVILIDIGKGWLAAAWLPALALPGLSAEGGEWALWLPVACAAAAVVGHVYPVFHGFRGGKGAATVVGAVAGLVPAALPLMVLVWLAVILVLGYVSLATMTAAALLPLVQLVVGAVPRGPLLLFSLAVAAFVIYTHRSNIARLRAGTEPRARRLWLLAPRR
ncbi:MAG: glycerol-3-phosphate 1-O-acyltransferase PlsY [Steroidobacteraceae bacterium]